MFRQWLQRVAFPVLECENCVGCIERGCYCMTNDASAPGLGPTRLQRLALWWLRT